MSGPIADTLRAQRDFALVQLDDLIRRGRQLGHALAADPADAPSLTAAHAWQQSCAAAIHQLSGGSKAHWLSRAFSSALLVRSAGGDAVTETGVREIVDRILGVLHQARASLGRLDDVEAASSTAAPAAPRFDFVHDARLRPVLETAFAESGDAFDAGDFPRAMRTSCSILEAIITDALEHCGSRIANCGSTRPIQSPGSDPQSQSTVRIPQSEMALLSFDARIAAAESSGLIRGGCARLPPIARAYRIAAETDADISERDARLARQVLHVVMRDLNPGR
jgi:hypothetical protein